MKCSAVERWIVVLCVVAVGLGQTLFASTGVRCTDSLGTTRIEYACIKTAQGACVASCVDSGLQAGDDGKESEPTEPTPCEDEPLGLQTMAARLIDSGVSFEGAITAVAGEIGSDRWSCGSRPIVRLLLAERGRNRPPDSLTRLRSIILIV